MGKALGRKGCTETFQVAQRTLAVLFHPQHLEEKSSENRQKEIEFTSWALYVLIFQMTVFTAVSRGWGSGCKNSDLLAIFAVEHLRSMLSAYTVQYYEL